MFDKIYLKTIEYIFPLYVCFLLFHIVWGKFELSIYIIVGFILFLMSPLFSRKDIARYFYFDPVDILIFIILVFEFISFYYSSYRYNSFISLKEILFTTLFYFLIKINLQHRFQLFIILFFLLCIGLYASLLTIYSYCIHIANLKDIQITDFLAFRNLFLPANINIGLWSTLLLLFLPAGFCFYLICEKQRFSYFKIIFLVTVALQFIAIIVTFSKGPFFSSLIYFGTILFFVGYTKLLTKKAFVKFVVPLFIVVIGIAGVFDLSGIPILRPLATSVKIVKTESQKRSFEGRKNAIYTGLEMIDKKNLIHGIGPNNFAMYSSTVKKRFSVDHTPVTLPFNHFLQLLVEKGIVSLFFYILLYGILLYKFINLILFKRANTNYSVEYIYIVCGFPVIIAVLFRDISYSSIIYYDDIRLLFWFYVSTIQSVLIKEKIRTNEIV